MKIYCARTSNNLDNMSDVQIAEWACGKPYWLNVQTQNIYTFYIKINRIDKTYGYNRYYFSRLWRDNFGEYYVERRDCILDSDNLDSCPFDFVRPIEFIIDDEVPED